MGMYSGGRMVRRKSDSFTPVAMNPADVLAAVRAHHGQHIADRVQASMEFLNGGPIDMSATTKGKKK